MSPNEDDPFAVFDDSDGDNETEAEQQLLRDPGCGVLVFHSGTEQALLHFVKNGLSGGDADATTRKRILSLVDDFCFKKHWMMHVGQEKGATLEAFLTEAVDSYMEENSADSKTPFMLVELGTYCGYSSLRMAHLILQRFETEKRFPIFHIFTVDVREDNVSVAREFVSLGGLESYFTFIILEDPEKLKISNELSTVLSEKIGKLYPAHSTQLNFLFIDHDKDAYLPDLRELEQAKFVRAGTYVVADNVVFFQLDSYRQHVQQLADKGIVTTRLIAGFLEYVDARTERQEGQKEDMKDGMGKAILETLDLDHWQPISHISNGTISLLQN